ncbi:MAG: glycosyltransferase, partial [Colwellia sp.]
MGKILRFVPDKVVYCASRAMKQHIAFGYSVQRKSIYIPNGYEFLELTPRKFKKETLVLGAARRFHDAKDYRTLFKAVAPILNKYEGIRLKVAGRDINNANVEITNYIDEFSIAPAQIDLLGQLNDMPSFYNSVDFFILSSKTEGFPNVLAEAAGYGCITFSTDAGDAGLIVNDEKRLVKIGGALAISKLLECYINKPSKELNMIANKSAYYIRETYSI